MFDDVDWNKPDFVNAQGVKWWIDKSTTHYALKKDLRGIELKNWKVFIVEEKSGRRTRLLVDDMNNIIEDSQSIEAIGAKIDMIKCSMQFSKPV